MSDDALGLSTTEGVRIKLGSCYLDLRYSQLRSAAGEHIALRPRSLAVLGLLARNPDRIISKDEILSAIWRDVIVTEDSLTQCIADIRRAIGDREHRIVRTVARRGYFLAPGNAREPEEQRSSDAAPRTRVVNAGTGSSPFAETRYAKSGDCYIAYQTTGEGPIDLVCVLGYVTHLELEWEDPRPAHFYRQLGSFTRLIRFDKRGTGLSDRVGSMPTLEQRMDDVRAVMDAAGSRRAVLFGLSEGGPLSLLFCATYPERVLSLVLYGAFARAGWAPDNPWGRTDAEAKAVIASHERLWGTGHSVDRFAPSIASNPEYRNWRAKLDRFAATPRDAVDLFNMSHAIDVRHLLPSINVPALVLHRKDDQVVKIEHSRFLADRIPGARYVELEGRDHAPWAGDPDAICEAIRAFVETTAQPQSAEPEQALIAVLRIECLESPDNTIRKSVPLESRYLQWLGLARSRLEGQRGREVANEDGALIVLFDGPEKAIRCARALLSSGADLGLSMRAGVCACEHALWRDGVDSNTAALSRSIVQHGSPGDILTTKTVADVIAGSGICLVSRGEQVVLEGFPGRWTLLATG